MTKNILKILGSIAISILAGYLALRHVQLKQVLSVIRQVSVMPIAVILILIASGQVLRSLRWGMLLEPVESVRQRLLLPITCIGFLFIWILPARIGEIARPYLLHQNSEFNLSTAIGSVVLERLIDASFLVALLAACLPALKVPRWLLSSFQGFLYLVAVVALFFLLGSLPGFRARFLQLVSRLLPARLAEFLARMADRFYSGMQAMASVRKMLIILTLTAVIWSTNIIAFKVLFHSMDMQLGWLAAISVLVLTSLGIALPAAPGFIGNYHYACVVGLTLFGVVKETALAYAILIHFLTVLVLVVMGVFFINASKLKVGLPLKRAAGGEQVAAGSRQPGANSQQSEIRASEVSRDSTT